MPRGPTNCCVTRVSGDRRPVMPDPSRPPPQPPAAPPSLGVARQMEIYLAGVQGRRQDQPLAAEELEQQARAVLRPEAYVYVTGGADGEDTVRANREAFRRWRIVPRFLRD